MEKTGKEKDFAVASRYISLVTSKIEKEKELLKELKSLKEKPNQEGIIEIGESALEEEWWKYLN